MILGMKVCLALKKYDKFLTQDGPCFDLFGSRVLLAQKGDDSMAEVK
jgi:hypothetical protein